MARATPAIVFTLLQQYEAFTDYIDEMIRVKTTVPEENQAQHIRDLTVAEMESRAVGAQVMMENILHAHKCYHGFCYVGPATPQVPERCLRRIGITSPVYRAWRVLFFTKE